MINYIGNITIFNTFFSRFEAFQRVYPMLLDPCLYMTLVKTPLLEVFRMPT